MKRDRTRFLQWWLCGFLICLWAGGNAHAEIFHTVKPGESLSSIAKKYRVTIGQIQEENDLETTMLKPGQKLTIPEKALKNAIPAGPSGSRAKTPMAEEATESEDADTHTVQKGETLGKIAKRYNLRVAELKEINQLKSHILRVGQVLYLYPMEEGDQEIEGETIGAVPDARETQEAENQSLGEMKILFAEEKDQQLLVRAAKSFMGARYKRGGSSITGMDCSSFVQRIFRIFEVELPRTAREQFRVGIDVSRENLCVGDLIFFKRSKGRYPTHVGIYIGNDQFIHTSRSKGRVDLESIESRYFRLRFAGAKRLLDPRNGNDSSPSAGQPPSPEKSSM